MVPVLVAAAVAAAGGFFVYKHWSEICEWFSKFLPKLKATIEEKMRGIAHAAVIAGEKIKEGVAQLKHKLFYNWSVVNKVDTKSDRGEKIFFKNVWGKKIDGGMRTLAIVKALNILKKRKL